jgi:hypothetical protein
MIPRFTIDQIIENSFYLWDSFINRPNFRAIQSFTTIWMLYAPVQWIGVFLSYGLFLFSLFLFNNQLVQIILPQHKKYHYSIAAVFGSIPPFLFIVLNEGYWYHSIIISLAFLGLILFFMLRYLYVEQNDLYLIAILLLFCFNAMISFNYIAIMLVIFFYVIFRLKTLLEKEFISIYPLDKIIFFSIIGFILYLIRVVLPTLSSSSFIEQEAEYELAQLNPMIEKKMILSNG